MIEHFRTASFVSRKSAASPPHGALASPAGQSATILAGRSAVVVEDEGITRLQIRNALTQAGMNVLGVAGDGESGVEMALRLRPDVILMDINLPGDINGIEATRQILLEYNSCVVVLSAYHDFWAEAKEAGVCGYITKPVTYQSLIPQLEAALAKCLGG